MRSSGGAQFPGPVQRGARHVRGCRHLRDGHPGVGGGEAGVGGEGGLLKVSVIKWRESIEQSKSIEH